MKKESDAVNHPSHYASGGIECIEAIKASMTQEAFNGYLKGNILKYLWRYEKKVNPLEDCKKLCGILIGLLRSRNASRLAHEERFLARSC